MTCIEQDGHNKLHAGPREKRQAIAVSNSIASLVSCFEAAEESDMISWAQKPNPNPVSTVPSGDNP